MEVNDIIKPENLVYQKPALLKDCTMHYCPGCSHSTVHKIVCEVIEEMGATEYAIGVAPVGCAVFAYNYIDIDMSEAAHGRAPAVATAIKRLQPDKLVFTYQGDGDLAAIGTCETIHTANRGENITIIFINNAIYGMTGGQMAPTTLLGQKTATTPYGRRVDLNGYPLAISNLLLELFVDLHVDDVVHQYLWRDSQTTNRIEHDGVGAKFSLIFAMIEHLNFGALEVHHTAAAKRVFDVEAGEEFCKLVGRAKRRRVILEFAENRATDFNRQFHARLTQLVVFG